MFEQFKLWADPATFLATKLGITVYEIQNPDSVFGGGGDILQAWYSVCVQTTKGRIYSNDKVMWYTAGEIHVGIASKFCRFVRTLVVMSFMHPLNHTHHWERAVGRHSPRKILFVSWSWTPLMS